MAVTRGVGLEGVIEVTCGVGLAGGVVVSGAVAVTRGLGLAGCGVVSGGVVMSDWVMVTRGFVVWSRNGVTRGVGMTRGVRSGAVVVSGGVALTSWVGVTMGVGADRGNHLSQLEETVVNTTPASPRTATMI